MITFINKCPDFYLILWNEIEFQTCWLSSVANFLCLWVKMPQSITISYFRDWKFTEVTGVYCTNRWGKEMKKMEGEFTLVQPVSLPAVHWICLEINIISCFFGGSLHIVPHMYCQTLLGTLWSIINIFPCAFYPTMSHIFYLHQYSVCALNFRTLEPGLQF